MNRTNSALCWTLAAILGGAVTAPAQGVMVAPAPKAKNTKNKQAELKKKLAEALEESGLSREQRAKVEKALAEAMKQAEQPAAAAETIEIEAPRVMTLKSADGEWRVIQAPKAASKPTQPKTSTTFRFRKAGEGEAVLVPETDVVVVETPQLAEVQRMRVAAPRAVKEAAESEAKAAEVYRAVEVAKVKGELERAMVARERAQVAHKQAEAARAHAEAVRKEVETQVKATQARARTMAVRARDEAQAAEQGVRTRYLRALAAPTPPVPPAPAAPGVAPRHDGDDEIRAMIDEMRAEMREIRKLLREMNKAKAHDHDEDEDEDEEREEAVAEIVEVPAPPAPPAPRSKLAR